MPENESLLRSAYRAFNARDIDAAVELMHPEVDWPNAWEGGRVIGQAAVRDYWNRQFAVISGKVEPEKFTEESDGSITVDVHQVVHDAKTGELLSDTRVRHRYRLEHGLITRMDVLETPERRSEERKQKRTETVGRLYNEGWATGNLDLMLEILDPAVVWTAIEDAPDAGTYRGYEGVRAYWQDWLDDFDMHPFRINESIEVGDRIACAQRGETTGKGSGVRSVIDYACVYTFGADERILEVNEYATWDEALDALQIEH